MERLWNGACDPRQYSPLALAFVGDCVYELFVRERLACQGNGPAGRLHSRSVERVQCSAQAAAVDRIQPMLTEEEAAILRRGRNANPGHKPRHADREDYHKATALEALFGYLYLKGDIERLRLLFQEIDPDAS